jgi:hypothetical protein
VSMAQMWTVIGVMATAFAAMIGFSYRVMTEQGKALAARLEGFGGEFNGRLDGLRGEVNAQIGGFRGEVNAQIGGLRNEVNAQIGGLRNEVSAQIQGLRAEMNERFDHLNVRVDKVESIDREVHALSIKVMGLETPPREG